MLNPPKAPGLCDVVGLAVEYFREFENADDFDLFFGRQRENVFANLLDGYLFDFGEPPVDFAEQPLAVLEKLMSFRVHHLSSLSFWRSWAAGLLIKFHVWSWRAI